MTALTGPIASITHTRTENRRSTQLPTAWLLHDRSVAPRAGRALLRDGEAAVPPVPNAHTLVVVSDAAPAAAASAVAAIGAGVRTYVLAPTDGTGDASLERLADANPTGLLIRRVEGAPAAALLSGRSGLLWIGSDGPGSWRLALDEQQVEAARRAVLELWWEHAEDEAWPSDGDLVWRARGDAPFDLPAVLHDAPVQLERATDRPLGSAAEARVYAPNGELPDVTPEQIWVPPSSGGHEPLADRVRHGSRIEWADFGLPICAMGDSAILVPSTSEWSLRVSLTGQQGFDLAQILDTEPEATFAVDVALGEVESRLSGAGRVWRSGATDAEELVEAEELDAGTVETTALRDIDSAEPATWPEPSPLTLSVRWTWRVEPPRAPASAADDPLVNAWRSLDGKIKARLDDDTTALGDLEQREQRLLESDKERGAALGFQRTRLRLQADLSACWSKSPSVLGPEEAKDLVRKLQEVEAGLSRLGEDIAAREHELLERTERERQEREHAAGRDRARDELPEWENCLQAAQQRLDDAEAELGRLASGGVEMSKKDRKAARRKAGDEQSRAKRDVERNEKEVERRQELITAPFVYDPPAARRPGRASPGSFIPPKSAPRQEEVPHEALPATGRLLRIGDERMLAIALWEDLEQGEQDAARLGARVVATAEGA